MTLNLSNPGNHEDGATYDDFLKLQERCHRQATELGFWREGEDRNKAEMIALMHSELSELLEAIREPSPKQSSKIPAFTEEEEELADLIIRAMDYAEGLGLRLVDAIVAKLDYNLTRAWKHGKKF